MWVDAIQKIKNLKMLTIKKTVTMKNIMFFQKRCFYRLNKY